MAIDRALSAPTNAHDEASGCTFFVQGSSGRGKTFLLNHVINYIIMSGGIVLTCAFTGIAASSLKLGRTAHSTFNISITRDDLGRITCRVTRNSKRGRLLRAAHVLIWDELGMMDNAGIEAVDRLLRELRDCDRPFGGMVFIGRGDLKQLAPVLDTHDDLSSGSDHAHDDNAAPTWWETHVTTLNLSRPMRDASDPVWSRFVDTVGCSLPNPNHPLGAHFDISLTVPGVATTQDPLEAVKFVYPELFLDPVPPRIHNVHRRAIMCFHNTNVNDMTSNMLARVPGD
ncbi:DNA helicase Pif1 like protein, partial [Catenaria anguillulae PL171]